MFPAATIQTGRGLTMKAKKKRKKPKVSGFDKNKRLVEAGETFKGHKPSDWRRR